MEYYFSTMPKIRVGILFGGRSPEHEVALQSAKSIVDAIDKEKYEVSLIGIDKNGKWYRENRSEFLLHAENPKLIALNKSNEAVTLVPWQSDKPVIGLTKKDNKPIDVIFPILHGTYGED